LLAQCVGPWQIEMDHDPGVLQVDAFRQEIGGEEQSDGVVWWWRRAFLRAWCETGECFAAANAPAGDAGVRAGEQAHAGDVG
jgi:hypothetical protein